MSYRSEPYRRSGERYSLATEADVREHRAHGQANARRRHPAQPSPPSSGYAFVHGRRQVRIGPVAFWICVGTLVIMAGWTMMTATYFAFRDDVLTQLIARQAEMQHAYEDRISEMRGQLDRVTSRQLLDQEQFEQKLDQIARRQTTIESRAATLGTLADPTSTGSINKAPPRDAGPQKPSPVGDGSPASDRGAKLERGWSAIAARFTGRQASGGLSSTLARMQESLDRVETRQTTAMANIEENFNAKARRMRSVLVDLGLAAGKALPEAAGGPFVPLRGAADHQSFDRQLQRINLARGHVDRLSRTLVAVPVRQPLAGELDQSSGFGVRLDPFFRRPAMHTGLDFRGDAGEPVRATAAGTVEQAGWNGGYGKLIEIDHGNGLSTRYGHLSEILVREGQSIKVGQIIGRIGSTGRSTGPHLHYETRNDGDAVDPRRFLRAGAKLGLAN
jgi:murein DD-endopeptidase MepM/ murein hydrolase activator NlpD